nr:hypothetical protein [Tanacetum cinerariifolium]
MRIPLLYRGEYSQWVERFMNYLEEHTDGEAMINSIKNDKSMWFDQEKRIQKIDCLSRYLLIQGLPNDIYSLIDSNMTTKDLWDALARHMLGFEYGEQDRKAAKKTVVVTSDPLALIAEKTKVSKIKEKVVVSSDSKGSEEDDFSELKKITTLLAKDFNRRKFYSKPTNNNLRTSSISQSANNKQEFVKNDNKKVEKKDDEKKKQIADQEVLYDKISVQLVDLDKHVRDLKNTVLGKDFKISELEEYETDARSDWWISSRAYFEGVIGQAKRVPRHLNFQNMHEVPSELYRQFEKQKIDLEKQKREIKEIKKNEADRLETYEKVCKFIEDMNVEQVRQANKGPIIVGQHYGISDLSEFPSMQNILIQGKRKQHPSFYKWSSYMEQPPSTVLPKKRGNKTKNNVKKSNLSPLNLRNALDDDNEGGDDVIFLGSQFT